MSYAQVAELTWGQLMHAMGVSPNAATDEQIADSLRAAQDETFRRIATRRRCVPKELMRVPVNDLIALVSAETGGRAPPATLLLDNLQRLVAGTAMD